MFQTLSGGATSDAGLRLKIILIKKILSLENNLLKIIDLGFKRFSIINLLC